MDQDQNKLGPEGDLEAPAATSLGRRVPQSVVTDAESLHGKHHQRLISELTFGGHDSTSHPSRRSYTAGDLTGNRPDLLAEDDFLRNMEEERKKGHRKTSSKMLVPSLPEDEAEEIMKSSVSQSTNTVWQFPNLQVDRENEDDPVIEHLRESRRSGLDRNGDKGLRNLTAQLMAANRAMNGTKNAKTGGLQKATKGTAVDKMAENAEAMFASTTDEIPEGVEFDETTGEPMLEVVASSRSKEDGTPADSSSAGKGQGGKNPGSNKWKATQHGMRAKGELFIDFVRPRRKFFLRYWWVRLKFVVLPGVAIAALLYYALGNPPHGILRRNEAGQYVDQFGDVPFSPSASWWILFLVRQVLTHASAKLWEKVLIDFLTVRTRFLQKIVGPYISLWFAQSKGWPFQAVAWGVINLIVLYGQRPFSAHWLYWQDFIGLFNRSNSAGNVVERTNYRTFIMCSIAFGAATAVKRELLSNFMGKRLVIKYGDQLEKLMEDVLAVTQIAVHSKRISRGRSHQSSGQRIVPSAIIGESTRDIDNRSNDGATVGGATRFGSFQFAGSTNYGFISSLLGDWEEPDILQERRDQKNVTIASMLHFRRALSYIDGDYPFSDAFGPAITRELCVSSSQGVFQRLLQLQKSEGDGSSQEDGVITLDVFADLVIDREGDIDRFKLRKLCKLLRPTGDGILTELDFIKAIDEVYRSLRTLVAAIESSSQIERNYESIINALHYFLLFIVAFAIVGFDVTGLLVSFGAFFVGVGFIIGGACAQFLEGLLMIFIQKPYDVGDRVSISSPTDAVDADGSPGWIVEKIDLYSTTLRFATTRELATVTNGALSRMRIINMQRSKKAIVYINLRFGIDTPHSKISILKDKVQAFVDERPREWVAMWGFRNSDIQAHLGFVSYVIVLQHQDRWQNIVPILDSKAAISSFVVQVSKELDIKYVAPPVPIDLSIKSKSETAVQGLQEKNETPESAETLLQRLEIKKTK